ncbi:serine/threonine protein kinase [Candidatus Micrarchaeota archaeon]|nr:serine/threonine protein kinase [Candidatus Micrarchaeota archaeon]
MAVANKRKIYRGNAALTVERQEPRFLAPYRGGMYDMLHTVDITAGNRVLKANSQDGCHERDVAIKIQNPGVAGNDAVNRFFKRELRYLAELSHPSIVELLECGVIDQTNAPEYNGCMYMVLEWLNGKELPNSLDGTEKLTIDQALRLMRLVCESIAYVHSHDIVHRDIKPGNIFVLGEAGQNPMVKLLDFSIALKTGEWDDDERRLGEVFGTPRYMAPEQAEGSAAMSSMDIYPMGVILYMMLTQKYPYTMRGESGAGFLHAHVNYLVQPPRQFNNGMTPKLERVILRCLEKDPGIRISSAMELHGELGSCMRARTTHRIPSPVAISGGSNSNGVRFGIDGGKKPEGTPVKPNNVETNKRPRTSEHSPQHWFMEPLHPRIRSVPIHVQQKEPASSIKKWVWGLFGTIILSVAVLGGALISKSCNHPHTNNETTVQVRATDSD